MSGASPNRAAGFAITGLARLQRRLYGSGPVAPLMLPGLRETAGAALALGLLTLLVYLPHLRHGGLMSDDWSNLADFSFAPSPRYLEAARIEFDKLGGRPLLGALLPLPGALFGDDPTGQIALGLALAAATSLLIYITLRAIGLPRMHALAPAALALVFAPSSAVRLWPTAGLNHVAVIFVLAGVLCTLRAFGADGRRALLLHATGLVLYAASIATYEVAGVVLVILGPLYLRFAGPQAVARRWAADIVLVGAALTVSALATREVRQVAGMRGRAADVPQFTVDAVHVIAATLTPFGIPNAAAILPFVLAALALALARPGRDELRESGLFSWAFAALAACVLLAAALVPFLGSSLGPASPGIENRANLLTGPVFAGLAYALLGGCAAAISLALPASARRSFVTVSAGAAAVLLVAGGWADARREQGTWRQAAVEQRQVVRSVMAALPTPAANTRIYTFGHRGEVAPRVPVFDEIWDLWGAVKLAYDDETLESFPMRRRTQVRCEADRLVLLDPERPAYEELAIGGAYAQSVFVDVRTATAIPVTDRRTCERVGAAVAASSPG